MAAIALLSVIASASQLAAYSTSILFFLTNLYERVQDVPAQYREFELQLQLLISTSRAIEKNPALQTTEVQIHLDATVIDVRSLQNILCPSGSKLLRVSGTKKYWSLITGREQKKILEHLENFHKKNTSLLLSISTVNTNQLSSLQDNMKVFKSATTTLQRGTGMPFEIADESEFKTGFFEIPYYQLESRNMNEKSGALVRMTPFTEPMPEKSSDIVKRGERMASNVFRSITINGSQTSEVHVGHTSKFLSDKNYGHDNTSVANEFRETFIKGKAAIAHFGNVGPMQASMDVGDFNVDVEHVVTHLGDFDTIDTEELWKQKQRGDLEKKMNRK